MPLQQRGEGRVVIGLPERLERTQHALRRVEDTIAQIKLVVESRSPLGDAATLTEIEAILRGENE